VIRYLLENRLPEPGAVLPVAPGVLWLRMPLPMALDHINLYLLEADDGWWVVDTGIALGPTEALWEQVFQAPELGGKPIVAVLCTHYHPDHIGMAGWLCERWRVPFYMTQGEYLSGLAFSRSTEQHWSWFSEQHMRRCGYDQAAIDAARGRPSGFGRMIGPMPTAYRRLRDGDKLRIGGARWHVVIGRGHSPEHACLYDEARNVLISGDQVIPRISSNISVMSGEPDANPLRDWLDSLEHLLANLPGDALVLPAHNAPFYGLHPRLRDLIEHHESHLLALEEACSEEPRTALELLPVLFSRTLDENHIGLAVGECVAHLNYLAQRGQLQREEDASGAFRYRSIDETLQQRLRQQRHLADEAVPVQV
jgi:glyoxylase-like metal-dependent hydrolase (beta-lactamase superfamily II)